MKITKKKLSFNHKQKCIRKDAACVIKLVVFPTLMYPLLYYPAFSAPSVSNRVIEQRVRQQWKNAQFNMACWTFSDTLLLYD